MKRNIIYWVSIMILVSILIAITAIVFIPSIEYLAQEPNIYYNYILRMLFVSLIGTVCVIAIEYIIEWLKEIIYKIRK